MATATYRPNAAGSNTNISDVSGAATHWEAVDESVEDGVTTCIYEYLASYHVDTYAFANPSETGTINNITLYFVVASQATGPSYAKAAIYVGSTLYYGDEQTQNNSTFVARSYQWATNPATSAAWTWSDLNSLEIGVALKKGDIMMAICTQVYVVIDYTPGTDIIGGPGIGPMMIF